MKYNTVYCPNTKSHEGRAVDGKPLSKKILLIEDENGSIYVRCEDSHCIRDRRKSGASSFWKLTRLPGGTWTVSPVEKRFRFELSEVPTAVIE